MRKGWNHNIQYYNVILDAIPSPCYAALDIGCGDGSFTRQLTPHCDHVTGIDIDSNILSRETGAQNLYRDVIFITGDVMTHPFPKESFDFISSIATLHHLPLNEGFLRFRDLLAADGVLAIIGLYKPANMIDYVYAMIALPLSKIIRFFIPEVKMDAPTQSPQNTLAEIRQAANKLLPGVVLKRRLFFRYTLVWCKK